MFSSLPRAADLHQLAAAGEVFAARMNPTGFQRLLSAIHEMRQGIDISIQFGVEHGVHYLRGELDTELVLICQRCMDPVKTPIRTGFQLGLVRNKEEEAGLPGQFEPLWVERIEMDLHAIVEDELLLALPLVPMHPSGECSQPPRGMAGGDTGKDGSRENPFAVLSGFQARGEC